jgi:hypothetical protein
MALTNLPTAQLKFQFRDETGSVASMLIHVPYATLAAAAIAAGDAIMATIVAITGCTPLGYSLTYSKSETDPAAADDGSRVENKGVFTWRTADGRATTFTVPGIVEAVLNPDGSVDRTNAEIIALVAVVEDVGAIFAGASGSDIVSLLSAYQRFNGSTRKQLPSAR